MVSCSSPTPALVLLLVAIFTAVSLPSIRSSSRPRLVAETIPLSASMVKMNDRGYGRFDVVRGGGRASAAFDAEDSVSAREVPTGPNPLHHNHNPITKPRKEHMVTHP